MLDETRHVFFLFHLDPQRPVSLTRVPTFKWEKGETKCISEFVGHYVAAIHLLGLCGPGKQCEVHLAGPYRHLFGILVAGNWKRVPGGKPGENHGGQTDLHVVDMCVFLSHPIICLKKNPLPIMSSPLHLHLLSLLPTTHAGKTNKR